MNQPAVSKNRRILVIDDNRAIHEDFRKILAGESIASITLEGDEAELFSDLSPMPTRMGYEVDSAFQGQEGLSRISQALAEGRPYAMAFVDVRMPPGLDGVETTRRIWELDPSIQIVLCSAYSDYSWDEVFAKIGKSEGLLILKKPFDNIEALQLAHALTEKWWLNRQYVLTIGDLENRVAARTRELRESAGLLRIAGRAARLGGWAIDLPDMQVTWSDEVCDIHETPPGSVPDLEQVLRFYTPQSRETLTRALDACRLDGTPFDLQLELKTAAGRPIWTRSIGEARREAGGAITRLEGALQDITEHKKFQQQFLRAQRMESIGTLASGIAHDLNNILQPITLAMDLLRNNLTDPESYSMLDFVTENSRRATSLVRQVLSFARGVDGERVSIQPNDLAEQIARIVRETFPKNIVFRLVVPENPWLILGDSTQLHQVILNLCVNSRDSMPAGGNLTLSMEHVVLDPRQAAMQPDAVAGRYMVITVDDTGTGIPPELHEKIFDPFFTTKEQGYATGLGLATTLGIVRSHSGFVTMKSMEGEGTTFQVFIPAGEMETNTTNESAGLIEALAPGGGGELILVVDDEEPVLKVLRLTLESFGYRVLTASNGLEGGKVFMDHSEQIDAVITDMVMPVMDGSEMVALLKKLKPSIKIIAISGMTPDEGIDVITRLGVGRIISKPFTTAVILEALREALDGKPAIPDPRRRGAFPTNSSASPAASTTRPVH